MENTGEFLNQSQLFFSTSKTKLIVMSICTFSIYILYWFYKNWKILETTQGLELQPFRRTLCAPIFCYGLFRKVQVSAKQNGVSMEYRPGWLTIGFVLLVVTLILPFPISLMTFLLPALPLLPVQGVINSLNAKAAPEQEINNRFSVWNIVAIVFGVFLWGLLILGIISSHLHS